MKFTELMTVKDEVVMPYGSHHRMYHGIKLGNFTISIQASEFHYCRPRKTLPLDQYTALEVAIFDKNGWVNPKTDVRFNDFENIDIIREHWESGDIAVGGYVPVNVIQSLCDYLEKNGTEVTV